MHVTARDKATNREQKVTITASTNLNKGEIDRMVQEARQNEAADRKQRELVEARNNADSLAYQTEKTLKELGDKVHVGERQNIQAKIDGLREAITSDDMDKIKRLSEELQNASYALSQQLYAQQQPGGNGNGRDHGYTTQTDDQGEVIEGEYR